MHWSNRLVDAVWNTLKQNRSAEIAVHDSMQQSQGRFVLEILEKNLPRNNSSRKITFVIVNSADRNRYPVGAILSPGEHDPSHGIPQPQATFRPP